MPILRFSEIIGTAGADSRMIGANQIFFGLDGDDTMSGSAKAKLQILVGGPGNDIYYLDAAGVVTIAENGGSSSDKLVMSGIGLVGTSSDFAVIDNAHLVGYDAVTKQQFIILDYASPANRIESIAFSDTTVTGDQLLSSIIASGNFLGYYRYEDVPLAGAPYSSTDFYEAMTFYIARNAELIAATAIYHDLIQGTDEPDLITAGNGDDTVYGQGGADTIYGNTGRDSLFGGDGNDALFGGQEDDYLSGGSGDDVLYGNLSDDLIYGENGDDVLYGGQGRDTLFGGDGTDTIYGNLGFSLVYGGEGADLFVVRDVDTNGTPSDVMVADFDAAVDRIGILFPTSLEIATHGEMINMDGYGQAMMITLSDVRVFLLGQSEATIDPSVFFLFGGVL